MTKKLYYACAIEAIYMLKYFNVKYENTDYFELAADIYHRSFEIEGKDKTKYPYIISPESYSIFEFIDNMDMVLATQANGNEFILPHCSQQVPIPSKIVKEEIIMREGKPFFMPEMEVKND